MKGPEDVVMFYPEMLVIPRLPQCCLGTFQDHPSSVGMVASSSLPSDAEGVLAACKSWTISDDPLAHVL